MEFENQGESVGGNFILKIFLLLFLMHSTLLQSRTVVLFSFQGRWMWNG